MRAKSVTVVLAGMFLGLFFTNRAFADTWGDYQYTESDGKITITGYTGPGGYVEIPSEIAGKAVTAIGPNAFRDCRSLTSVTIPSIVTSIGEFAFCGCDNLTSVTISEGVTSIGNAAFYLCTSLTSVMIPSSVTSIGDFPFFRCDLLQSITVDESNAHYASMDGVLYDKDTTSLVQCPQRKSGSLTIPEGVTSIGEYACYFCIDLTSVTIPSSVTSIGEYAFYYCYNLTSVTIPSSVTSIGEYAFAYCSSLTSVFFYGNAPVVGSVVFGNSDQVVVYFFEGASGWPTPPAPWQGRPTVYWAVIPTFTPDGGVHEGSNVQVTVSCATVGATIRYTTNGTEPTEESDTVASDGQVTVPLPGTLKARAWKAGMHPSAIKSANYARKAAIVMNDYDGNGISELAVYDNNVGSWYAYSLQTGQATVWGRSWGWPGAETVPGDYDGDAFSDMAVYDQNTGYWYVWSEVRGIALLWARPWGWPGAETVYGDYDGDAMSDMAVYDQSSGSWYIASLSEISDLKSQMRALRVLAWDRPWGWTGAITVPGDYDWDGKNDLCVYDQNTGYWYVQTLAGTVLAWAQPWGWPGATTVPGDYDSDGKSDMAVYDQPSGAWYVWSQAKGQAVIWAEPWGWTGAVPVPGDYDGDGYADLAVFDTITGYWYVWSEVKGVALAWAQNWGWPGANPPGGR